MKAHNHLKKLRKLIAQGKLPTTAGSVSQVDVAHDAWCRIFKGKRCHCDPDIRVAWIYGRHAQN
jgi:hypothetical protein